MQAIFFIGGAQLEDFFSKFKNFFKEGGTIRCQILNDFKWFLKIFFKKKNFIFFGGGTIRLFFQILKIFFEGGVQLDGGHKKIEYGIFKFNEL